MEACKNSLSSLPTVFVMIRVDIYMRDETMMPTVSVSPSGRDVGRRFKRRPERLVEPIIQSIGRKTCLNIFGRIFEIEIIFMRLRVVFKISVAYMDIT